MSVAYEGMEMRRRNYYDFLSRFYGLAELFENHHKRAALDMADLSVRDSVLDIGCGRGYVMGYLSSLGHEGGILGIDFSKKMVGEALEKSRRVCVADCLMLPFFDRSFDVAVASFVLDLFGDECQKQMIGEVARVLKDGGKLVMVNNTRGRGVFYALSGFYLILRRIFPDMAIDKPIDSNFIFSDSDLFQIEHIGVFGFTEIAVLRKKSYI